MWRTISVRDTDTYCTCGEHLVYVRKTLYLYKRNLKKYKESKESSAVTQIADYV